MIIYKSKYILLYNIVVQYYHNKGRKYIMTLEQIKDEIEYYTGKKVSDDEAKEILWHYKNHNRPLEEIISAYYGC